jgi:hypothetical protein
MQVGDVGVLLVEELAVGVAQLVGERDDGAGVNSRGH